MRFNCPIEQSGHICTCTRLLFVCILTVLLGACSANKIESSLVNYLQRLANIVSYEGEIRIGEADFVTFAVLKKDKKVPDTGRPSTVSIDLLDFLALRGCALQPLVAMRNSGLGIFSERSQQLIYVLKFLHFAPACISTLESDDALVGVLDQAVTEKKKALPSLIVNALLLGPEAEKFWKKPVQIGNYPDDVGPEVPQAIRQLDHLVARWLKGDYQAGWAELEGLLFYLQHGEGGQLYSTLRRYEKALEVGNALLRGNSERWCRNGHPVINVQAAKNVVAKYFVGDVQQWASVLSQRYYAVIEPYTKLESRLQAHLTQAYLKWKTKRQQALQSALNAAKPHVVLLQNLMEPCTNE